MQIWCIFRSVKNSKNNFGSCKSTKISNSRLPNPLKPICEFRAFICEFRAFRGQGSVAERAPCARSMQAPCIPYARAVHPVCTKNYGFFRKSEWTFGSKMDLLGFTTVLCLPTNYSAVITREALAPWRAQPFLPYIRLSRCPEAVPRSAHVCIAPRAVPFRTTTPR